MHIERTVEEKQLAKQEISSGPDSFSAAYPY